MKFIFLNQASTSRSSITLRKKYYVFGLLVSVCLEGSLNTKSNSISVTELCYHDLLSRKILKAAARGPNFQVKGI